MKLAISDEYRNELEAGALEGIKVLRARLSYQGSNEAMELRAKAAGTLVKAFTSTFASETNRAVVELTRERMITHADQKAIGNGRTTTSKA